MQKPPHRTVVYIDGFNFYYGEIKGTRRTIARKNTGAGKTGRMVYSQPELFISPFMATISGL